MRRECQGEKVEEGVSRRECRGGSVEEGVSRRELRRELRRLDDCRASPRSAMTICSSTLDYIWAGVHSHKCLEVEPA
jgi:hypothetical protein